MEKEEGNIMLVCKECCEKMYPNKGTFDVNVGDFVKLKFTDGNGTEYMWVEVIMTNENNKYEGRLDNDPAIIQCVKCDDNVEFQKEDILQAVWKITGGMEDRIKRRNKRDI